MQFISRLLSTFYVSKASSSYQATLGTLIVTLVIIPILNVIYSILFGADLGTKDHLRTALATVIVGISLSIVSGVVSKVATDRNLGVFQEVNQVRDFDLAYWLGSIIMPVLLLLPTSLLMFIVILLSSKQLGVGFLFPLIVFSISAILIGVLLGISMAGFGVLLSDPYQGATVTGAIIPITSGVIVPSSLYPEWLQNIVSFIPMSGMVSALSRVLDGTELSLKPVLFDLAVASLWACLGVILVRLALARMRSGQKFSAI